MGRGRAADRVWLRWGRRRWWRERRPATATPSACSPTRTGANSTCTATGCSGRTRMPRMPLQETLLCRVVWLSSASQATVPAADLALPDRHQLDASTPAGRRAAGPAQGVGRPQGRATRPPHAISGEVSPLRAVPRRGARRWHLTCPSDRRHGRSQAEFDLPRLHDRAAGAAAPAVSPCSFFALRPSDSTPSKWPAMLDFVRSNRSTVRSSAARAKLATKKLAQPRRPRATADRRVTRRGCAWLRGWPAGHGRRPMSTHWSRS